MDVIRDVQSFIRENQQKFDACDNNRLLQQFISDKWKALTRLAVMAKPVNLIPPLHFCDNDHPWVSSVYLCIKLGHVVAGLMDVDRYSFVHHNFSWTLFLPMISSQNSTALAYYYSTTRQQFTRSSDMTHDFLVFLIENDNLAFFQQVMMHETLDLEFYHGIASNAIKKWLGTVICNEPLNKKLKV